jgi:hypothetical protein
VPVAKLNFEIESDEKATKRRGQIFGFYNRKTTQIIFDDICFPLYFLFILGSGAVQRKPVSEENNVLQYNTLWNVNPRQFKFFPLYTQPSLSSPIPLKGRGKIRRKIMLGKTHVFLYYWLPNLVGQIG